MSNEIRYQLPAHIRMRIVRAIEHGARFDSHEERSGYVLTATVDKRKRQIFETPLFAEMHQAIMFLLELRRKGTSEERRRQKKRSEDFSFYRSQRKAREDARKATRIARLRRKFYGEAAA